jgi:hypothetical protein
VSCTLGDVALCFSGVRRNRLPYTSSRSGIYECGDGEIRSSMVVRTVRSEYGIVNAIGFGRCGLLIRCGGQDVSFVISHAVILLLQAGCASKGLVVDVTFACWKTCVTMLER